MTFQFPRTLAVVTALALTIGAAEAQELRVSSHEPQQGFFSQILQTWIDRIAPHLSDQTSLRLYPGGILGAPPAQADLVRAGVADIAFVVPTYTAGLFPMTSVAEVPGLIDQSASGTEILNTLLEEGSLGDEYSDYRVLALFTTPGYRVFSTEEISLPTDMAGLRLRSPSAFGASVLEMTGASGVPIPAPQVYENIERNVVSGAAWTMDAYRTFRLNEVAPNITTTRLIASPLAVLMNRASYDSLPVADKAVFDAHSGRALAEWIAEQIDTTEAEIETALKGTGIVTFSDLAEAGTMAWQEAGSGAADAWLTGQQSDAAAAVLARAREIAARE